MRRAVAGGPYRDATPGLEARLAEVRRAWLADAEAARRAHHAELVVAATAGEDARATALAEVLLVITVLTLWLDRMVTAIDAVSKCGHGTGLQFWPTVVSFLALFVAILRSAGRRSSVGRAQRAALRAATLPPADGADAVAQIDRLSAERPAARLAALLARLTLERRVWSMVARGLVLVILPFLFAAMTVDPAALLPGARLAAFPLGILALGLLAMLVPRSARGWRGGELVVLAIVLNCAAAFFHPVASVLALLESWVVVRGLIRR